MGVILAAFSLSLALSTSGQTNFQFSNVRLLTNRELALTLTSSNAPFVRVDSSADLSAWQGLVTVPASNGSLSVTDTAAPYLSQRIYRAQQLTNVGTITGDHLATTNGEIVLHPISHATFLIGWQGKAIYNDPTNGAAAFPGLPKADLILVTHAHTDHFNAATLEALRGPGCVIITSQTVYSQGSMTTALRAITAVLGYGASTNVMGLQVQAVPAYNSYHPINTGNGYVLTIGEKRIYIAGDTGDIPEMRSLSNIDIAFLPMNVPYTMPVSNAAAIVRDFRPRVVYPYHFRNQDGTFANLNDFKQRLGQDLGIEARLRKWY